MQLMDFAIVIALIAEVLILSRLERGRIATRLTPFNILAFPYVTLVVVAYFVAPLLDLVPLSSGSIIIWMLGLFIIWMMGMLLTRGFLGGVLTRRISEQLKSPFCTEASSVRVALWLGMLLIPVLPYKFLAAKDAAGGWLAVGTPEFKAAYLHGPLAHVVVLCIPIVILLLGTATLKTRLQLAVAATIMFFILLGQAKGITLQPLVGAMAYRLIRGRALMSLKTIGIIVLCGVLVFVAVDLTAWGTADSSQLLTADTYGLLARHFCFYILAGPLALAEAVRSGNADIGGSAEAIFAPFLNIYRVATGAGDLVSEGSTKGQGADIDLLNADVGHSSNVFTFFGTLYLYLGAFGATLYVAVCGLLCYLLLMIASGTRNELLLALYCFIGSQLFFGFFELYFWHLTAVEVSFIVLGAYFLQHVFRRAARRYVVLGEVHA
jgi:hypothetical protein